MLRPPPRADLVRARTSALAATDHQKHLLERFIAALAHATGQVLLHGYQQRAGIFDDKAVRIAFNHNTTGAGIVAVDECVDERLAQRFMGRCHVAPHGAFQLERRRQSGRQFCPDPAVELKQIRFPRSVWINPVGPAQLRIKLLPVIHEIVRRSIRIAYRLILAEHQQPGQRQSLVPRRSVTAPSAKPFEKIAVRQCQPRMLTFGGAQSLAVLGEARPIDVRQREACQEAMVRRHLVRIRKHATHFGIGAAIIALVATTVGMAKWRSTDIDRALCARGARNTNHEQRPATDLHDLNMPWLQQVDANLPTIIEAIPKRLLIARNLLRGQSIQARGALLLAYAQYHHATFRIGHGAIGLPKTAREPASCRFKFPVGRLPDVNCFKNAID